MKLFKNNVGRPSNTIKKKRKIFILTICILSLLVIFSLSFTIMNKAKLSASAKTYYYVKSDSILRKNPSLKSSIKISVIKGTKVIVNKGNSKNTKNYYYVTIPEDGKFYIKKHTGYILKKQLTSDVVKMDSYSERTLTITQKTALIKNAYLLYTSGNEGDWKKLNESKFVIGYNNKVCRNSGYNLVFKNTNDVNNYLSTNSKKTCKSTYKSFYDYEKKNGKESYFFDCSSFVSTVLKATFKINTLKEVTSENGTTYLTTYHTYDYNKEVKKLNLENNKSSQNFTLIDKVDEDSCKNNSKCEIDTTKLRAGDIILGINKENKSESDLMNHIMIYVGDGYIIHSTGTIIDKDNKKVTGGISYGKLSSKYIKLGKKYSKRIYILRLNRSVVTENNQKIKRLIELNEANNEYILKDVSN